jgi:hypothetical protein
LFLILRDFDDAGRLRELRDDTFVSACVNSINVSPALPAATLQPQLNLG